MPARVFSLMVLNSGTAVSSQVYDQTLVTIGRTDHSDVVLDNQLVSRQHAEIRREGDVFTLIDLGTNNGTFLNGKRIRRPAFLNGGDEIIIGKFTLRFDYDEPEPAEADDDRESDPSEVAGYDATIAMTEQTSRRVVEERGRARGHLTLPTGQQIHVKEAFQVGRDPACDLTVGGWLGPRKAAVIVRGMLQYTLFNVGRAGWVHVNGKVVPDMIVLHDGDAIVVRGVKLAFKLEARGQGKKAPGASVSPAEASRRDRAR